MKKRSPSKTWTPQDVSDCYGIDRWGNGHFIVNEDGNIAVPHGDESPKIDLLKIVNDLRGRGYNSPILLRFSDILRSRIETLNHAFQHAIQDCGFQGKYRGVFPIKVNQARTVIEEIVHFSTPFHYGLEAGSKAELLAILAVHKNPEALIICNGYKDDAYVRMALLGSSFPRKVVLVIEKPSELERVHRISKQIGIAPVYGIRVRLSAKGAGKWHHSSGDFSKFGLTPTEILQAIEKLQDWGELNKLHLLHFHLGSQVTAIRSIKNALREATCLYAELRRLGCSSLSYLDVGGGLGVDYDGSQTNYPASMNYSIQEYANDVIHEVMKVCEQKDCPHPNIVSESGRAITAHHSVLIVEVLEVTSIIGDGIQQSIPTDSPQIVRDVFESYESITSKNLIESYHDALAYREQSQQLFNLGHLSIRTRVLCDDIFWACCRRIVRRLMELDEIPEELEGLERKLCDTYFLNFSLFQSLPDSWAIGQLFPVMPIHRLNEQPTRRGILADITCDSDGRIDKFVDLRDIKRVLELHSKKEGEPYYLGLFLVGAYQEILGDLHNLFGDTHTAHISMSKEGYKIESVVKGDTMSKVLSYVNYSEENLIAGLHENIKHLNLKDRNDIMSEYKEQLSSYTYLRS